MATVFLVFFLLWGQHRVIYHDLYTRPSSSLATLDLGSGHLFILQRSKCHNVFVKCNITNECCYTPANNIIHG